MVISVFFHTLEDLWNQKITPQEAEKQLRQLLYEDLDFVKIDHHRALRKGFPEVVFCQGKTQDQILTILKKMSEQYPNLLATRAQPDHFLAVQKEIPDILYHPTAHLLVLERKPVEKKGCVTIISAGTADLPIAEEAAVTAEIAGSYINRIYDIGIAGIHRLFSHLDQLWQSNVIVAVAGMEGALPGVVSGMVGRPVIAVPTSVGYGAHFQGLSALLTMLNSCSPGIATVNIDNGFGAGYLAHLINQLAEGEK
ncbi:MAG TPA: nickel pincer cofactor biosynthesis protein LarB [Atribacter sp.]|jgi:NCAIR mutase (PurE)-related protein|uniref:AIR carboxylase n=2 Tax=Atribacter TaxID=2847777 RepID=A0A1V5SX14_9BACT|nr:nickel pincer cofactor biosynthesis protein LarB [Atribacterota bacterium]MDI9594822.1 nickel pincer cofactor biosynthesis protein LarB [Atribacterota bacterium]OQA58763.1 MAG: AIR carboxylase [Candidatus Atribacteria bacterium ADurb.Bin276]HHT09998.1 nickel pincer cofactor biosynthesis protein LarB [Candidatus Atribacteria bacterium]HQK82450.1 nickel pincer cofactor biosynthesis protein LarB [Atribacter sp.]